MIDDAPDHLHQFASDNTAGICPEALQALVETRGGHQASYGNDDITRRACDKLRELFECDADIFFVFNGTAANSLALAALCQSYQSVICSDVAHVETDECGAPEFFSNGSKLLLSPHADGKLLPADVVELVKRRTDIHCPRPRVVSLTQSTELGTLYGIDEIEALGHAVKPLGLKLHMDGARFANAVAALGCSPADLTWRAGIDVLCFGGTKMGLPVGEAIVFFDRALAQDFAYRCKQAGQLASKMRYLSAPWLAMLKHGTWLHHAGHANAMAARLSARIAALPGVSLLRRTQVNSVFAMLPVAAVDALRANGWSFYTFIGGGARFMCSWSTTEAAVDRLADDIAAVLAPLAPTTIATAAHCV